MAKQVVNIPLKNNKKHVNIKSIIIVHIEKSISTCMNLPYRETTMSLCYTIFYLFGLMK